MALARQKSATCGNLAPVYPAICRFLYILKNTRRVSPPADDINSGINGNRTKPHTLRELGGYSYFWPGLSTVCRFPYFISSFSSTGNINIGTNHNRTMEITRRKMIDYNKRIRCSAQRMLCLYSNSSRFIWKCDLTCLWMNIDTLEKMSCRASNLVLYRTCYKFFAEKQLICIDLYFTLCWTQYFRPNYFGTTKSKFWFTLLFAIFSPVVWASSLAFFTWFLTVLTAAVTMALAVSIAVTVVGLHTSFTAFVTDVTFALAFVVACFASSP